MASILEINTRIAALSAQRDAITITPGLSTIDPASFKRLQQRRQAFNTQIATLYRELKPLPQKQQATGRQPTPIITATGGVSADSRLRRLLRDAGAKIAQLEQAARLRVAPGAVSQLGVDAQALVATGTTLKVVQDLRSELMTANQSLLNAANDLAEAQEEKQEATAIVVELDETVAKLKQSVGVIIANTLEHYSTLSKTAGGVGDLNFALLNDLMAAIDAIRQDLTLAAREIAPSISLDVLADQSTVDRLTTLLAQIDTDAADAAREATEAALLRQSEEAEAERERLELQRLKNEKEERQRKAAAEAESQRLAAQDAAERKAAEEAGRKAAEDARKAAALEAAARKAEDAARRAKEDADDADDGAVKNREEQNEASENVYKKERTFIIDDGSEKRVHIPYFSSDDDAFVLNAGRDTLGEALAKVGGVTYSKGVITYNLRPTTLAALVSKLLRPFLAKTYVAGASKSNLAIVWTQTIEPTLYIITVQIKRALGAAAGTLEEASLSAAFEFMRATTEWLFVKLALGIESTFDDANPNNATLRNAARQQRDEEINSKVKSALEAGGGEEGLLLGGLAPFTRHRDIVALKNAEKVGNMLEYATGRRRGANIGMKRVPERFPPLFVMMSESFKEVLPSKETDSKIVRAMSLDTTKAITDEVTAIDSTIDDTTRAAIAKVGAGILLTVRNVKKAVKIKGFATVGKSKAPIDVYPYGAPIERLYMLPLFELFCGTEPALHVGGNSDKVEWAKKYAIFDNMFANFVKPGGAALAKTEYILPTGKQMTIAKVSEALEPTVGAQFNAVDAATKLTTEAGGCQTLLLGAMATELANISWRMFVADKVKASILDVRRMTLSVLAAYALLTPTIFTAAASAAAKQAAAAENEIQKATAAAAVNAAGGGVRDYVSLFGKRPIAKNLDGTETAAYVVQTATKHRRHSKSNVGRRAQQHNPFPSDVRVIGASVDDTGVVQTGAFNLLSAVSPSLSTKIKKSSFAPQFTRWLRAATALPVGGPHNIPETTMDLIDSSSHTLKLTVLVPVNGAWDLIRDSGEMDKRGGEGYVAAMNVLEGDIDVSKLNATGATYTTVTGESVYLRGRGKTAAGPLISINNSTDVLVLTKRGGFFSRTKTGRFYVVEGMALPPLAEYSHAVVELSSDDESESQIGDHLPPAQLLHEHTSRVVVPSNLGYDFVPVSGSAITGFPLPPPPGSTQLPPPLATTQTGAVWDEGSGSWSSSESSSDRGQTRFTRETADGTSSDSSSFADLSGSFSSSESLSDIERALAFSTARINAAGELTSSDGAGNSASLTDSASDDDDSSDVETRRVQRVARADHKAFAALVAHGDTASMLTDAARTSVITVFSPSAKAIAASYAHVSLALFKYHVVRGQYNVSDLANLHALAEESGLTAAFQTRDDGGALLKIAQDDTASDVGYLHLSKLSLGSEFYNGDKRILVHYVDQVLKPDYHSTVAAIPPSVMVVNNDGVVASIGQTGARQKKNKTPKKTTKKKKKIASVSGSPEATAAFEATHAATLRKLSVVRSTADAMARIGDLTASFEAAGGARGLASTGIDGARWSTMLTDVRNRFTLNTGMTSDAKLEPLAAIGELSRRHNQ